MPEVKRKQIYRILVVIIAVSIFAMLIDLSRLFGFYSLYKAVPNDVIKRITVVLSAYLLFISHGCEMDTGDLKLMKIVICLAIIGEAAFLTRATIMAIVLFAICQLLLIYRHSKGMLRGLMKAAKRQKMLLMSSAGILAAMLLTLRCFAYICFKDHVFMSLMPLVFIYGIILSTSLLAALTNYVLKLTPKANSKLIAAGMVCFYLCDICVGLDGVMKTGFTWMLVNSAIWLFYTPAVVLLSLSCLRLDDINSLSVNQSPPLNS
ncbi:MAG: hypothetical protein ACOZCL_19490 [Bacillota bacterium]